MCYFTLTVFIVDQFPFTLPLTPRTLIWYFFFDFSFLITNDNFLVVLYFQDFDFFSLYAILYVFALLALFHERVNFFFLVDNFLILIFPIFNEAGLFVLGALFTVVDLLVCEDEFLGVDVDLSLNLICVVLFKSEDQDVVLVNL